LSSRLVFNNGNGVVVANARVGLLKVDVNSYGLHEVQRILLVEGQAKLAFGSKLRYKNILFNRLRVVLARSKLNSRVNCLLFSRYLEAVALRGKAV
jgi:hypothetical protein